MISSRSVNCEGQGSEVSFGARMMCMILEAELIDRSCGKSYHTEDGHGSHEPYMENSNGLGEGIE